MKVLKRFYAQLSNMVPIVDVEIYEKFDNLLEARIMPK